MTNTEQDEASVTSEDREFDFDSHRSLAVDEYARVRPLYEAFASAVRDIIRQSLDRRAVKVHSVEGRAKSLESFGAKAALPDDDDPTSPRYGRPLDDIIDLAGVRAITYFPRTVEQVRECIGQEFDIREQIDLGQSLVEEERLGYQSVHYLVKLWGLYTTLHRRLFRVDCSP